MKSSSIIPWTCSIALASMLAAGTSHWWSVSQMVAAVGATPAKFQPRAPSVPLTPPAMMPQKPAASPAAVTPPVIAATVAPKAEAPATQPVPAAAPAKGQQEFFETLVAELKNLRQQNQDLREQIGETNRDMMDVQFRLDTHSESFRPLKVNEPPPEMSTTHDSGPGVLPPRALSAEDLPLPVQ